MKSPYQVLEIEEGASQEEIKLAYRKLVKKYHPDKYENNPLADLAQEKLQEINAAYDTLTKSQGQSQAKSQNQQYRQSSQNLDIYNQIRRNIEINNIIVAEQMLDGITNRGAEWNFLKGVIAHKKGWYDQALRYITVAVSLEPGNAEYVNGLNNLRSRNTSYRNQGNYRGYSQRGSFCDICSSLLIADCCCECMGGDLISCC